MGSSISVPVWEISWEEDFWENTLLDSLRHWLFSPLAIVWLGYNLDMLFFLMLSIFWTVEIRNKHSVYSLFFSHSRSASLKSIRLNPCFWKFHHLMKLIFGYVILIIMHYNLIVWLVWNIIHLLFMVCDMAKGWDKREKVKLWMLCANEKVDESGQIHLLTFRETSSRRMRELWSYCS